MSDGIGYVPLGHDNGTYYVLNTARQQVVAYTATQLTCASGCLDVVGDYEHWESNYGDRRKRINWQHAAADIMLACARVGIFDASRIRGRGVWLDDDRVILHLGDTVLPDGPTDYIYHKRPAMLPDWTGMYTADDWSAPLVRALCSRVPWLTPMHAELLAGWIALAPVCGALSIGVDLKVEGDVASIVRACLGGVLVEGALPRYDARPSLDFRHGYLHLALTGAKSSAVTLTPTGPAVGIEAADDLPMRLLSRQVMGLPTLLANIAMFRSIVGDSMGTLLAGAFSLYGDDVLSEHAARGYLGRYDL